MPKVAVIILTWNGMKYLPDCLGSLINQDYEKVNREYIIVDNASSDGTVNYIKENFSEFSLIENDKNYGFDKGNNIGIKYALDKGYDYIVLLNQDTVVDPSWLSELVKAAESDKKIGGVQSLMLYWENANQPQSFVDDGARRECESESTRIFKVNSWGNELHFLGFGFCGGNGEKLREQELRINPASNAGQELRGEPLATGVGEIEKLRNSPREMKQAISRGKEILGSEIKDITYASSAAVLYRASVLREVGCFDEEFFLYHEDTDLSFKIKMAGYRVVLAPMSIMCHNYEFSRSIKKYYYMERNRYRILLTYFKLPTLILIFPAFIAMEGGMWLFALKGGWVKEKLRAYRYMLNPKNLADIYKKRRRAMRTRRLSDKEFTKYFVGEIMYQETDNPLLRYIANPMFRVYWEIVKRVIGW